MYLYCFLFGASVYLGICEAITPYGSVQSYSSPRYVEEKTVIDQSTQSYFWNHNIQQKGGSLNQNCNKWSSWINRNKPSSTTKNDHERIEDADIRGFCPVLFGADASKINCRDNLGEAYSGIITNAANQYTINCTDMTNVTCTVFEHSTKTCADISVKFYCNCSTLSSTTVTNKVVSPSSTTTHKLTSQPQAAVTNSTNGPLVLTTNTSRIPDQSSHRVPELPASQMSNSSASSSRTNQSEEKTGILENKIFWLILFVVCVVLSISNCILMIILHKRSMKYAKDKSQTKVEPY